MSIDRSREEWAERVRLYGPHRAVLNVKNATREREAEFNRNQESAVGMLLAGQLVASDRKVLDVGCGTGRWAITLADMVGEYVGIDPTPDILSEALWMVRPGLSFRYYGEEMPAQDAEFDVVFACLVLNAILYDEMLADTVASIDRVLKPGGLVFLVDVTKRANVRTRWSVLRSVDEYVSAFASVAPLRLLGEYLDLGETHSIMAGRKAQ